MNLIRDPWIPVRRRGGARERIAPWQLTHGLDDELDRPLDGDPIVAFASPRADFDGALAQFLIGLLQTAFSPARQGEWDERFTAPPPAAALRQAFAAHEGAFELFGEGPRFLQDRDLLPTAEAEPNDVEALLIEAPGGNTVKLGKALFVRERRVQTLCPACAATALFDLQTHAPSGGQGHRTSLRGGGPLVTLIWTDQSLWHALWLNVLTTREGLALAGNPDLGAPEHTFPWLAPTRTSEKGKPATTPLDVHPWQQLWGMPRRIRLLDEPAAAGEACSLCAEAAPVLVRRYLTRNYGVNYLGSWRHPLTPTRQDKDGAFSTIKGDPAALSYRHWLGLVVEDGDNKRQPAEVVRRWVEGEVSPDLEDDDLRLWVFGFDMDNMKARAWCDGRVPLLLAAPQHRVGFAVETKAMVLAARLAAVALISALKQAFAKNPKHLKGDLSPYEAQLWEGSQGPFESWLPKLLAALGGEASDLEEIKRGWHRQLASLAFEIFDTRTGMGQFRAVDPGRLARARQSLLRQLWSKTMRRTLALETLAAPPRPDAEADADADAA